MNPDVTLRTEISLYFFNFNRVSDGQRSSELLSSLGVCDPLSVIIELL